MSNSDRADSIVDICFLAISSKSLCDAVAIDFGEDNELRGLLAEAASLMNSDLNPLTKLMNPDA
jgi:hypothetical protein